MFAARLSRASSIVSPQEGTSIVHNSKSPTILALYKLFYQLIFCHHRLVSLLGEEITGQGSNPGQSPYAARGARARLVRPGQAGLACMIVVLSPLVPGGGRPQEQSHGVCVEHAWRRWQIDHKDPRMAVWHARPIHMRGDADGSAPSQLPLRSLNDNDGDESKTMADDRRQDWRSTEPCSDDRLLQGAFARVAVAQIRYQLPAAPLD